MPLNTTIKSGYRRTDVGVIPEDWIPTPLPDACWFQEGPGVRTHQFRNSGVKLLNGTNIVNGQIRLDTTTRHISIAEASGAYKHFLVDVGDILLATSGITIEKLHEKVAYARSEHLPLCMNTSTIRFKVYERKLVADYLYFFLQSDLFKTQIERQATGSAQLNFGPSHLAKVMLPLPRLEDEQRAIAAALSDVDDLIEALGTFITKKRDLKQATMQLLLTGTRRLPGFSGEWRVTSFGAITAPRKNRVDPRRTGAQEFCIELEHLDQGTGKLLGSTIAGTQSSLKSMFRPGDVLFGKLRAYLRKYWLADRAGVCSTEIWAFVPDAQEVIPEFLFQVVQTDHFIEVASFAYGTHMPRSDWSVVRNYEVAIPGLDEQAAIAKVLSDIDDDIAALEQRREKASAIKQGMMQELLTGKTRLL